MARILIVDDDEMERLLERTILESAGHELYFAKDGADALRFFRANDVDLVITDLNMPRIDGHRVIQGVKEVDDRVPVIVVSGTAPDQLDRAHDLGAFETLFKPVDPQVLLDVVGRAAKHVEADDGI